MEQENVVSIIIRHRIFRKMISTPERLSLKGLIDLSVLSSTCAKGDTNGSGHCGGFTKPLQALV